MNLWSLVKYELGKESIDVARVVPLVLLSLTADYTDQQTDTTKMEPEHEHKQYVYILGESRKTTP